MKRRSSTNSSGSPGRKALGLLLLGFLLPVLVLPAGNWVLCVHSGSLDLHLLGVSVPAARGACPGAPLGASGLHDQGVDRGVHSRLVQTGPPPGGRKDLPAPFREVPAGDCPADLFPPLPPGWKGPVSLPFSPFPPPGLASLRTTILLL